MSHLDWAQYLLERFRLATQEERPIRLRLLLRNIIIECLAKAKMKPTDIGSTREELSYPPTGDDLSTLPRTEK